MTNHTPDLNPGMPAESGVCACICSAADELTTAANAVASFAGMAKKYIDDKDRLLKCLDKLESYALPLKERIGELVSAAECECGAVQSRPGTRRILLVEDNELNREIAKEILEENGFAVDEAEDGCAAVRMVSAAPPTHYVCVLMDISMPGMDGLSAAREIRALQTDDYRALPIIAMTANEEQEDIQKTFAAGMNAHLSKPVRVEVLMRTLEQFL